jgi:hypothetical protein
MQAEVLGEQRGQHQVRQGGGVAAQQAVDVLPREARVGQRERAGLRHQVQAVAPFVPCHSG